jgi:MoaA/NifB/PqqE/SkfB family radical SAM enzyme
MLQEVEIDPINICNRSCSFCPRGQGFADTKEKLTVHVSKAINKSLREINYSNIISFCGFGESLLHKHLEEHIKIILDGINPRQVLLISNGDRVTPERLRSVKEAGITDIRISLYDSDTSADFISMNKDIGLRIEFRHNYGDILNFEVNRNEINSKVKKDPLNRACYIPFEVAQIDFNGDMHLCCNDWSKQNIFGNVKTNSIKEMWSSKHINSIRNRLAQSKRDFFPFSTCDVDGCLSGKKSFDEYAQIQGLTAASETV